MEAFGIAIVLAAGLAAAPLFCFALIKLIRPMPALARLGLRISTVLLALFAVELLLVYTHGIVATRMMVGPLYFLIHLGLTSSAAPALACLLVLGRRSLVAWWPLTAAICWVVGAGCIFYQYNVAEALYGIDLRGGPFQRPW